MRLIAETKVNYLKLTRICCLFVVFNKNYYFYVKFIFIIKRFSQHICHIATPPLFQYNIEKKTNFFYQLKLSCKYALIIRSTSNCKKKNIKRSLVLHEKLLFFSFVINREKQAYKCKIIMSTY